MGLKICVAIVAREAYGMEAVYVHDPTAFAAVIQPELFTWKAGPCVC